ncbi:MAG: type II toxin-antitoxin system CcdA family antitoxin [Candidatus Nanopelagicales bacterium]
MARLNVYLPDELAAEVKKAGLNLSAVTQDAVRRTLAERSTDAWLAMIAATASDMKSFPTTVLSKRWMPHRDEAPTRHN